MQQTPVLSIALLAAFLGTAAVCAEESSSNGTWAFQGNGDPAAPSPIDLRWLNEPVAGSNGWLRCAPDGNSFLRGDGQPIRFWGAHPGYTPKKMSEWNDAQWATHARWLARMGVNIVRLGASLRSGKEGSAIEEVDPDAIAYVQRSVAVLKHVGIYSMVSIYWGHQDFGGPVPASFGIEGYSGPGADLYGLIFFEPTLQRGWRAWMRKLLTETNRYTGVALKDDPALAFLEIANEDTLLFHTLKNVRGGPRRLLERRFAEWAAKRHGSLEQALKAWGNATVEGDNVPEGRLGLMINWFLTAEGVARAPQNRERACDQARFLAETMRAFNTETIRWLKQEIGFKGLVNTSNFVPADLVALGDLELWTKAAGDLICMNSYAGGMQRFGKNTGWRTDAGDRFIASSLTTRPRTMPPLRRQVDGKGYFVTETLWPLPHVYEHEGPLMTAAFLGITGVDAAFFAGPRDVQYDAGTELYHLWTSVQGSHPMKMWDCASPGTMGQFPAAALIHRRGDIREPTPVLIEARAVADLFRLRLPAAPEIIEYDPNRFKGLPRPDPAAGVVQDWAWLGGAIRVNFTPGAKSWTAMPPPPAADGALRSATGEVVCRPHPGLVTINTPRAQAAIGFLGSSGEIALGAITLTTGVRHAAIAVVSLDDHPLATSKQVLVQIGMPSHPTGWKTKPVTWQQDGKSLAGEEVVNTGSLPWQIERASGTLAIRNAGLSKATLLDGRGVRSGAGTVRRRGPALVLELPPDAIWVVLE